MNECSIYVMLTRADTAFSRVIHLLTGDSYTHAAIGFEGVGGDFYGFGRKYPKLPFPGAFRKECPWLFSHAEPVHVYRLRVSQGCYDYVKDLLATVYAARELYHYNVAGVVACRFGLQLPRLRSRYFFCSQFVAWVLQETGALELPVPAELFRPVYFCDIPELELVYEGEPSRLRPKVAER